MGFPGTASCHAVIDVPSERLASHPEARLRLGHVGGITDKAGKNLPK